MSRRRLVEGRASQDTTISCSNTDNETSERRTLSRIYESLDYHNIENVVNLEHRHKAKSTLVSLNLQRWIVIFLIGITIALSGFVANFAVSQFTRIKFTNIIHQAEKNCPKNGSLLDNFLCMAMPMSTWLLWNIIPSTIGAILVTYVAPVASGSGIPVVKCYLNGVRVPEVVRLKSFFVKIVGVVCSVVGGLAAGKEGPFVHCGAVVAAGISQGRCTSLSFDTGIFRSFRNDRDKRDFVSAGASAGVACAFGAPIGGLLFALEEGSSFWDQLLTWRIFFCSMITSFTLNLLLSASSYTSVLSFHSLVNFGLVAELDYYWFEVPIYIMIAVIGGLTGSLFCYLSLNLTICRRKYLTKKWMKVLEVTLTASASSLIAIFLILLASDCQPTPKRVTHLSHFKYITKRSEILSNYSFSSHDHHHSRNLSFMCPEGQYSAMSSLWLSTSEGVSSNFMVKEQNSLSIKTMTIFLIVYFILAVWTYGMNISGGIFIPSLLIGAVGGRLIAKLLEYFLGPAAWLQQPNKFAILGAVSVLGGVVRMTISLTVIIVEATGAISFGLPIMICLMVSKWVGDFFIEGLYDITIHLNNVPFLGWEPPEYSYSLYASDIMSLDVVCFKTTETVGNLIRVLKTTTHNGFPVIDYDCEMVSNEGTTDDKTERHPSNAQVSSPGLENMFDMQASESSTSNSTNNEDIQIGSFQRCLITKKRTPRGRYRGLVLRTQLIVMLQYHIFNEIERSYDALSMSIFSKTYPLLPSIEEVSATITKEMYSYHIDLRSIMNSAAYTVLYSACYPQIFTLFRSLGLRHLTVTDDRNEVVGIITRKDLARYVGVRDKDGVVRIKELQFSS